MMQIRWLKNSVFIFCMLYYGCSSVTGNSKKKVESTNLTELKFKVEEAPEWTALFKRTSGWFGADGIFAIPLNGREFSFTADSNLIFFSDSMIGEVENGKPKNAAMVHNTAAILTGNEPDSTHIHFYWDSTAAGKPETIFIPRMASATKEDYYWLGDGFKNSATKMIYVFAYRMRNLKSGDDWSFRLLKTDIMALPQNSKPPFKDQRQIETPLAVTGTNAESDGSFGAGIFVNTKEAGAPEPDGYIYVYGIRGRNKTLIASRVLPQYFEDFSRWTYWDGKQWSSNINQCDSITDHVSNELSLSPLPDGRYALVFQLNGMSTTVAMRIGASPVGPFGPVIKLYECPEPKENRNYITYNAKAHPSLSKAGELLISYNVNAFDFKAEINNNPNLYRPRFIRLKFEQ